MAALATKEKVKEKVKESLLGAEQIGDIQLSAQSRATFEKNAKKNPETGEMFMGQEEFINAIAPAGDDYVSRTSVLALTSCN